MAVASLESGVKRWRFFILFILFMKRCEEMKSLHPLHEDVWRDEESSSSSSSSWRIFILFMKRCEEMKNLHPLHPLHEEVWRDEESSSSSWRGVKRWRIFVLFMKRCEEMKNLHPLHEEVWRDEESSSSSSSSWRIFILFMKRCEEMKNLHPLHPLHEEVWRDEESGLRKFSVKNFILLKNPQKVVLNPFQPKNFFLPNKIFFRKKLRKFWVHPPLSPGGHFGKVSVNKYFGLNTPQKVILNPFQQIKGFCPAKLVLEK